MIENNIQEHPSIGTRNEVPSTDSTPNSQLVKQPTLFDYLALLPVLITAATPLILGFKGKTSSKQNREDRE